MDLQINKYFKLVYTPHYSLVMRGMWSSYDVTKPRQPTVAGEILRVSVSGPQAFEGHLNIYSTGQRINAGGSYIVCQKN